MQIINIRTDIAWQNALIVIFYMIINSLNTLNKTEL